MTAARVGLVSFWHETNEYSRRLAGLAQWQDYELLAGDAVVAAHDGTRSVLGGFIDGLGERAVPVFAAGAWPSGPAPAGVLDELLGRLSEELRQAGPLDAVALNLHGAMVAEGADDVEAEVVRRIRAVHGDIPIAAVLDLHGNPSLDLAGSVDALIAYQTYPHVDMWECGQTTVALIDRMLAGERLFTSIAKLPFLTCPLAQGTDGPLGAVLDTMVAGAPASGVARASVMAGFAYQDAERVGMSVLAVSAAADRERAEALVTRTAEALARAEADGAFEVVRPDAATAVAEALTSTEAPVVLVDIADNIGAGSAGDGTVILEQLLLQGGAGAVVVIADADVVRQAVAAGPGSTITAALGGKTDDLHGATQQITATVRSLGDGRYTTAGSWATGQAFEMGDTAVLDSAGITIVVTERATPPFHREHLTSVGIDPAAARILVAKGAVAWRSAYGDDARTVIEVDAPGACPLDPWTLPRSTAPATVFPARTPRAEGTGIEAGAGAGSDAGAAA
ncbi:M81 family metallopeptidase [Herbiconiux sp. P17]|uniref:M81 family metallopeptidase n=1 Tax=Herbiconiux wuyangfengii TaxID=3342794 RepID=UPI0035BA2309